MMKLALVGAVLVRPVAHQLDADTRPDRSAQQRAALVPGLVVMTVALAQMGVQVDRQPLGDVVAEADVVPGVEVGRVEADEIDAAAGWWLEAG
jgi:hypothetical protein